MYIQTNLKQEFLSTTKYDGLIPLPKSEEPGKPTLDCRTLQLLFQWERAKKKNKQKKHKNQTLQQKLQKIVLRY